MSLDKQFHHPQLLEALHALGASEEWYLVGGAVRDWLLGRDTTDLDLATPVDPTSAAKEMARHFSGHWFWLDRDRRQSRVVIGEGADALTLDFAPFRAPTFLGDLSARDFTVNAIALRLGRPMTIDSLIDPLGGYQDLQKAILRSAGPSAFVDDPLRILRGIRHALELEMEIESGTLTAMQQCCQDLDGVAVERVRQEVWRILKNDKVAHGLRLLQSTGAGRVFGSDLTNDTCRTIVNTAERCREVSSLLSDTLPEGHELLNETIEDGLDRATLLIWSFVMRSLAVESPSNVMSEWRCSRQTIRRAKGIASVDVVSFQELDGVALRSRSLLLWAARKSADPYDLLLAIAIASELTAMDAIEMLLPYFQELLSGVVACPVPSLVDGHWLCSELGIKPGLALGKVMDLLQQAEIEGRVTSEEDVRTFLTESLQKND
jgi:poly(A) polymerase